MLFCIIFTEHTIQNRKQKRREEKYKLKGNSTEPEMKNLNRLSLYQWQEFTSPCRRRSQDERKRKKNRRGDVSIFHEWHWCSSFGGVKQWYLSNSQCKAQTVL